MMLSVSAQDLKHFKIFDDVSLEKLQLIANLVKIQRVKKGTPIIEDGSTGTTMYFLLEGEVEITKSLVLKVSKLRANEGAKLLNRFSSDQNLVFGEIALLDEKSKRSATVVAAIPCKLGVIPISQFLELAEGDLEIGFKVFRNMAVQLARQLVRANEDVLNLTTALSFAIQG